ncbi:unnamed protein product [Hermetia illucens]|uniref:Protein kintoun n=1 Tax=Hermetia illucens TaxID=343691 RepID=A0A7R8YP59_HERIL|nr:protein kintoun [Hermetia illucens]CAD7077051.1 unnamed protein product [Hermetia illucens]
MARSPKSWEDLNLTRDEVENMTKAFKDETFKKMFFDYCEEIQSPENRRIFQQELTQLEAERGVDITFINPEPGFVAKTSVDGTTKAFVNIAQSDKVERPKSNPQMDHATGKKGLMWSIPLSQAPPRKDFDKKGGSCMVFDVVFHPDALRMAEKNAAFKKHLVETACDAVEREHKVKLDRANLKFPKIAFKGVAQPTVIRKMSDKAPEPQEPSPIDDLLPPLPKESGKPKSFTSTSPKSRPKLDDYTTPQFVIKHRRAVDYSEMTFELDAKLNVTIPRELVVEISLPLLNSTSECNLDVTERKLYLKSTQPAKYKLNVDLPFPVNDKEGFAKFDKTTRKLTVTLPVVSDAKERTLKDLYREDSGVESDVRDDSGNVSPSPEDNPKVIELPSVSAEMSPGNSASSDPDPIPTEAPFLDPNIEYNFPPNFDCNTLDDNLAFTLHVKNVQPDSIEHVKTENSVHVKFSTVGAGFYPVFYAFYVQFPSNSKATIREVDIEPWDNNVIVNLALADYEGLQSYQAGPNTASLKDHPITEDFVVNPNKFNLLQEKDELEVSVKPLPDTNHIEIEIKSSQDSLNQPSPTESSGSKQTHPSGAAKKHKKKNKKRRSLSESACDEFKSIEIVSEGDTIADIPADNGDSSTERRKLRSLSESRGNDSTISPCHKGILKYRSRYERSMSESCSSFDEHSSFSCSVEFGGIGSFDDIPEEGRDDCAGLSESCKKTVRFSDVIKRQLFRLDSSILGQRKKNQKKKSQKLRARQRRNSEGDSIDDDDKSPRNESIIQKKSSKHDSGLDLSVEEKSIEDSDDHSDHDGTKNGLMFDMEI